MELKELLVAADTYRDDRSSSLGGRAKVQAFSEKVFIAADAVTFADLAKDGVRTPRGHAVDPAGPRYKACDKSKFAVHGRTNQNVLLLDSAGRSDALPAHNLPSARSQGEPISSRLNPPSGASFKGALMGADTEQALLATDAGYGFVTSLQNLYSKNRAGKAMLTVPAGAQILPPQAVADVTQDVLAAVSNEGRLLVFQVSELPELARGKGNKIMNIPAARAQAREEYMLAVCVLKPGQALTLHAGRRHLTLKATDLEHYRGERGRRGNKLPRGFQKVDRAEVAET